MHSCTEHAHTCMHSCTEHAHTCMHSCTEHAHTCMHSCTEHAHTCMHSCTGMLTPALLYCGFQVACHKITSHMRNKPVDFELVYCACVVTSNLKTAVLRMLTPALLYTEHAHMHALLYCTEHAHTCTPVLSMLTHALLYRACSRSHICTYHGTLEEAWVVNLHEQFLVYVPTKSAKHIQPLQTLTFPSRC